MLGSPPQAFQRSPQDPDPFKKLPLQASIGSVAPDMQASASGPAPTVQTMVSRPTVAVPSNLTPAFAPLSSSHIPVARSTPEAQKSNSESLPVPPAAARTVTTVPAPPTSVVSVVRTQSQLPASQPQRVMQQPVPQWQPQLGQPFLPQSLALPPREKAMNGQDAWRIDQWSSLPKDAYDETGRLKEQYTRRTMMTPWHPMNPNQGIEFVEPDERRNLNGCIDHGGGFGYGGYPGPSPYSYGRFGSPANTVAGELALYPEEVPFNYFSMMAHINAHTHGRGYMGQPLMGPEGPFGPPLHMCRGPAAGVMSPQSVLGPPLPLMDPDYW